MDYKIIIFIVIILVFGATLFAVVTLKQKAVILDKEKYRTKWMTIENSLIPDQQSTFQLSILNADKLLGEIMTELGIRGKTVGEMMKNGGHLFSNENQIWQAHKIRNRIAHEPDIKLTLKQAQVTLRTFKQALKDMGAI